MQTQKGAAMYSYNQCITIGIYLFENRDINEHVWDITARFVIDRLKELRQQCTENQLIAMDDTIGFLESGICVKDKSIL